MSNAACNEIETWSPPSNTKPRLLTGLGADQAAESDANLRRAHIATLVDQHATSGTDCGRLWDHLKAGVYQIEQSFSDNQRHYLLIRRAPRTPQRHSAENAGHSALEQILLGVSQKCLGLDLGLAFSTIALRSKRELERTGLSCPVSKAPLLLAILVQANRHGRVVRALRVGHFSDGVPYTVISVARPELGLEAILSAAELSVVRGLTEGHSHREVARNRRTSARTVANQVNAAFRRLRISGRSGLLHLLATMATAPGSGDSPRGSADQAQTADFEIRRVVAAVEMRVAMQR